MMPSDSLPAAAGEPLIDGPPAGETGTPAPVPSVRQKRPWRRRILWTVLLILLGLLVRFILHLVLPRNFKGSGEPLAITLPHGTFQVLYYNTREKPKGIVILGTGDGGWSYWEENTAQHLAKQGYAVGGWDCRKFADTRTYDHAELCAGFKAGVEAVRDRADVDDVPVWYGGWSTGAEQSVAAAASPDRPKNLVGLLLAAPGERGRFGLTSGDLLGVTPTGPGTFALADFAPQMAGLPVAQFVAGLDPMDDVTWLDKLRTTPHRQFPLPGLLHDMGNAGERFQSAVDEAMAWTLGGASE
ncbi:MAG: hypothetical protein JWM59_4471 [Verrucomicrobiales bacterium]|nr:hypothetical protein [Verrucomicrobiales bacterium]